MWASDAGNQTWHQVEGWGYSNRGWGEGGGYSNRGYGEGGGVVLYVPRTMVICHAPPNDICLCQGNQGRPAFHDRIWQTIAVLQERRLRGAALVFLLELLSVPQRFV